MEVRSELHLKLDKDEPRRVAEEFEEIAMEHGVPMGIVFKFQLALDELLTNVVSYAFEEPSDAVITVVLHFTDTQVTAVIEDNGRPFNPLLDAPIPDLDLSGRGPHRRWSRNTSHPRRSSTCSTMSGKTDGIALASCSPYRRTRRNMQ